MKKLFWILCAAFFLQSCAVKVPLSQDYLNKPSKVGLLVNVTPPSKYRSGTQGLLDLALTSGDKYAPVLKVADEKLNPKTQLIAIYADLLKAKGKEVVIMDEVFDSKTAPKFKSVDKADSSKKYSNYDFRYAKEKYGVDEVMFVNLNWGLMIDYYSMIEIGKSGFAYYDTRIINTNDNSLYLANDNSKLTPIKGKWDVPPVYDNVIGSIKKSLDDGAEIDKTLLK